MKSSLFLFLLISLTSFAQDMDQELDSILDCYYSESDCLNRDIIKDSSNIRDLVKAVSKLEGISQSQRQMYVNLYAHSQAKNEVTKLALEQEVLKRLGECLIRKSDYETSFFDRKVDSFIQDMLGGADFYWGETPNIVSNFIAKETHSCVLKKISSRSKAPLKKEVAKKECIELAKEKYLETYLLVKPNKILENFISHYGKKKASQEIFETFRACHKQAEDNESRWECYNGLNVSFKLLKKEYMVENLPSDVLVLSKRDVNGVDVDLLSELKKCSEENSSAHASCFSSFFENIKISEKFPGEKRKTLKHVTLERCKKAKGFLAEKECLDEIEFVLKVPAKSLATKLYYRNLGKASQEKRYDRIDIGKNGKRLLKKVSSDEYKNQNDFLEEYKVLNIEDIMCIKNYTAAGYGNVNRFLWSSGVAQRGKQEENEQFVACTIRALHKISVGYNNGKKGYKEYAYRGMGRAPFVNRFSSKGECIVFTGFTSTSYTKKRSFGGQYQLKIKNCPRGSRSTGVTVRDISSIEGEDEVLFPPGVRFKVTKANDGSGYVELECITEKRAKKEKLNCH